MGVGLALEVVVVSKGAPYYWAEGNRAGRETLFLGLKHNRRLPTQISPHRGLAHKDLGARKHQAGGGN